MAFYIIRVVILAMIPVRTLHAVVIATVAITAWINSYSSQLGSVKLCRDSTVYTG